MLHTTKNAIAKLAIDEKSSDTPLLDSCSEFGAEEKYIEDSFPKLVEVAERRASLLSTMEEMDLEREKTKMESFDSYILVSVLTATTSFSTLQSFVPFEDIREDQVLYRWLVILAQMSAGLSTICGLYATVVFSLTVLYAKSAIGMQRDAMYRHFMKQTAGIRIRGFRAFTTSLMTFALEAGIVTVLRVPEICRIPVLICVMTIAAYLWSDWRCIIKTATVIYTNKIPGVDKEKTS